MTHFFACDSSCPSFNIFRSDPFIQLTHVMDGDNEVKILTIPHLKMYVDIEQNTFKKRLRKEANGNCIEAKENIFFQFIHDGATLLNKYECQAFGMQFADRRFRCNNILALLFIKSLSSKSNMTPSLVEEVCDEAIDKVFNEMPSQSFQELEARKVAK